VLRTTLKVGFPGETEQDFQCLLDVVEEVRFDHLGAFAYSCEKDLPSKALKGHVAEQLKNDRYQRLMTLQAALSAESNQKFVGQILEVLVEGTTEGMCRQMVGRAVFQAPEVDGVVYINEGAAKPGTFVKVRITGAQDYDLTGQMI
jgi:ribosomal protein S12 methylthiotransferase